MEFGEWNGFNGGEWQSGINVRDFIVRNYTPYTGSEDFLSGATARTEAMRKRLRDLLEEERKNGGVLDIDTEAFFAQIAYVAV